jgi:serine/threonine-protein kinase RsbW
MGERLEIELRAVPDRVPVARGAIRLLCEQLDLRDELADDVRLAVAEACSNGVLHAYEAGDRERCAMFALEARVEGDSLLVVVRDSGSGVLRPRSSRAGFGVGLGLVRQTASSVEVLARPGRGTRVAMRFALR